MEISLLIDKALQSTKQQPQDSFKKNELEPSLDYKKIRDCSDEEIKEVLRYIMMLIGLKGTTIASISDVEKVLLIDFIRKNYSGHTSEEIRLAFRKAVSGDLDVDATAYENFSCAYLGKIMKSYRVWAANYYRESGLEIKAVNNEIISLPPSKYDATEWVKECFEKFLSGELNIEILPERVYDIAVENGLMDASDEKKIWCVKLARQHVLNYYSDQVKQLNPLKRIGEYKAAVSKLENLKNLKGWDVLKDSYVNRYSKAVALREYFHELKNNNQTQIICLCLLKPSRNT